MIAHLLELRQRLLRVFFIYLLLFLLLYYKANAVFQILIQPLMDVFSTESHLITTSILSPLVFPITLAAKSALLFTTPFLLYQLWKFIAPGLYQSERNQLFLFVISSVLLFVIGVVFCFYCILPLMFQLVHANVLPNIELLPDVVNAADFIIQMLLIFGLCFQIPILCFALVQLGFFKLEQLISFRAYWVVFAFILGMILTPPDVLSQVMLALPLCLLYEFGISLVRLAAFFKKMTL